MGRHDIQVKGIGIRDTVKIRCPRLKLKTTGMVTGIASGPGLTPYFRVRIYTTPAYKTQSPWFRLSEITRLGDELYYLRQEGYVK